ncbi:MAG TPA: tetratricopeptide repeat protein [Terriglobales bacterium]|nr:tetratricopeptide repeat protein [Terriglobales bacterium]
MKFLRNPIFVLTLFFGFSQMPSWGASKEMIQLQTSVDDLKAQMTQMAQSFNERMGVMKNLLDQNTDSMNKAAAAITDLQTTLQKQQSDSTSHVDQLSGQIQALNDTLDELKVRLGRVSKQLEDMQAAQQSLAAQQAQQAQQQQQLAQAPPPDVLYANALRDYQGGKNDLATQEFSDYIKFYPNTDLAGNAYFYLADIEYRQGNYEKAAADYDKVLQNFPSGNKAASAQLKKGYSLIELGQKDAGVAELRHLIQRYPRSPEATEARERLRKLGVSATAPRSAE